MGRDHDNLRSALQWLLDQALVEDAHRVATALWWFWTFHGHVGEGRVWLARTLALPGSERGPWRVRALNGAGFLAWQQSDTASAQLLHEEALAVANQRGDQAGRAFALHRLGDTARVQGDYVLARRLLHEALRVGRATGDCSAVAHGVGGLAMVADAEGDFLTARILGERALTLFSVAGSERFVTAILKCLGRAQGRLGNRAAARTLLEQSLMRARDVRDPSAVAAALLALSELALDEVDLIQARTVLAEALAIYREIGDRLRMVRCLEVFARMAATQTRLEQAFRLAGAADGLRSVMAISLTPNEQAELANWLVPARMAVGVEVASAAWAAGKELSLEQAMTEVLQEPRGCEPKNSTMQSPQNGSAQPSFGV